MAEFPWQSHSRAGASATKRRPSNKTTKTEPNLARNRKFESSSLQQTVRLSRDFSFPYRKAGSCRGVRGPGQAAQPAETRAARQRHAHWQ
jgi:hypothetical protein